MAKPGKEKNYQKIAERFDVSYYAFFTVVTTAVVGPDDTLRCSLFVPIAEIYEKGRWRPVVITGRPYQELHIARNVIQNAEAQQNLFLDALEHLGNKDRGQYLKMPNPIDNMKPTYEL